MSKELGRREQAHKRAIDPERSNFQVKTFFFNKKEASEGFREKRTCTQLMFSTIKTRLSSQRSKLLSVNSTPEDKG